MVGESVLSGESFGELCLAMNEGPSCSGGGEPQVGRHRLQLSCTRGGGRGVCKRGGRASVACLGGAAPLRIGNHDAVGVQAGTATSHRLRGEANSFNIIYTSSAVIRVERHTWEPGRGRFVKTHTEEFTRGGAGVV